MTFADQLRARGLRATPARLAVMRVLSAEPLTFAELHARVDADRATVFRTLRALVAVGLARDLRGEHGLRYKAASAQLEVHFACVRCGRSFALPGVRLVPPVANALDVLVRGRCC